MKILLMIIAFLSVIAVLGLCWMSIKMLNQAQKGTLASDPEKETKKDSEK